MRQIIALTTVIDTIQTIRMELNMNFSNSFPKLLRCQRVKEKKKWNDRIKVIISGNLNYCNLHNNKTGNEIT